METKHTPGPWISNDLGLQNVKGDGIAAYAADCYPNDDDARLIAAAPDLLAALETLTREWDLGRSPLAAEWSKARAAIRNAEGR